MSQAKLPRIGFVGLGIMGKPMARNLIKAGYELIVYDVRAEAIGDLVKDGAQAGESPRDVSARSDVLITMLPDSADVTAVYTGPNGAFEELRAGWLIIDMSSIAPRVSRELAERALGRGAQMLDAPVSGGDKGAIAGTLSIMVGGSDPDVQRALPILQALGKTIVHCGGPGAGQVVKLANQVVVAGVIEAVAEGLVLASKAGVDPERVVQVLQGGLAATKVLEMRSENMLTGRFDPGFRIRLHLKDLKNAMELAREAGVVLPATAEIEQLMTAALIAGRADYDHSGLITVIEDLAHFQVRRA
jgi:2-hydroxy-3-oxopropionate reductase